MQPVALRVHVALIAVQVLFGSLPVVGKVALRTLPGLALVGVRITLATTIFFMLFARARVKLTWSQHLQMAIAGLLGVTINQIFFILGLERTGAVNATVLVTTIPVFTLLFSLILRTERATPLRILGVVVAFGGALVVVDVTRIDTSRDLVVGNLFLLGNASAYALYLIRTRKLTATIPARSLVPWVFFWGTVLAFPFAAPSVVTSAPWAWSGVLWLSVLYIVLGPTVGTYLLNTIALKEAPPSLVAVYIYAQPLVAAVLAFLVLHESPTPRVLVGALFIFTGVFMTTRPVPRAQNDASAKLAEPPSPQRIPRRN